MVVPRALTPLDPAFLSAALTSPVSVRFCVGVRPPPAASGHPSYFRRKSSALRLKVDQFPLLVSFPASHKAGLHPPPRPVRLVILVLGVGGGTKETAPPAMVWSPLTRRQASPMLECLRRLSSSLFNSCGALLSVCPSPSPFPRTTVRVPILSLLTEEYFVVAPRALAPLDPAVLSAA